MGHIINASYSYDMIFISYYIHMLRLCLQLFGSGFLLCALCSACCVHCPITTWSISKSILPWLRSTSSKKQWMLTLRWPLRCLFQFNGILFLSGLIASTRAPWIHDYFTWLCLCDTQKYVLSSIMCCHCHVNRYSYASFICSLLRQFCSAMLCSFDVGITFPTKTYHKINTKSDH